jgi:5-methylcytosine-specific restriction endonuclease McrA
VILFVIFTLIRQTTLATTMIFGVAAYGCFRWRMQYVLRQRERQEQIAQQHWQATQEWKQQHWQATQERQEWMAQQQDHVNYPRGEAYSREISQEVKIAVAARDGGKCRNCGSTDSLEYDHVIPYSRGGTNTVNNIQLLCQPCNRSKGATYQQARYN